MNSYQIICSPAATFTNAPGKPFEPGMVLYFQKKDTTQMSICTRSTKQISQYATYQLRVLAFVPPVLYPYVLSSSVYQNDGLPFKMHKHLHHAPDPTPDERSDGQPATVFKDAPRTQADDVDECPMYAGKLSSVVLPHLFRLQKSWLSNASPPCRSHFVLLVRRKHGILGNILLHISTANLAVVDPSCVRPVACASSSSLWPCPRRIGLNSNVISQM